MTKTKPKKTINKKSTAMKESAKKTEKSVKVIKKLRAVPEEAISPLKEVKRAPYGFVVKLILVVALGTVLFLLAQKYRGQFLAGTINSIPVTRFELNSKMAEKYGSDTFDQIVSERLLAQELKKNNITISTQEVDAEMAKIIKDYGSEDAFKSALAQYKMTEEKAKESIKQSLALKKMIEKTYKIEITDEAVKKYFDDNSKTLFKDKKLEAVSSQIKDTLYQQDVYTKTQEWFTGIRKTAKIVSFI